MPFLRLCNLCFLFLFLWSLTLSSKYWVTVVFKRAKDIIHGRKFFYSLMSQVFLTLLLYFTFLLKHTSHLMFHRVSERFQLPCLWTSFFREGEGVRWQRWECFRLHWLGRSCQQGRSDLFFPEQQVSWEFGRIQVEDFFSTFFPAEREEIAHKGALLRGFSELVLLGGSFLIGWSFVLLLSMSCTLQRCSCK